MVVEPKDAEHQKRSALGRFLVFKGRGRRRGGGDNTRHVEQAHMGMFYVSERDEAEADEHKKLAPVGVFLVFLRRKVNEHERRVFRAHLDGGGPRHENAPVWVHFLCSGQRGWVGDAEGSILISKIK